MRRRMLWALLAGGASVLAFEPFAYFPLALFSLTALAGLLRAVERTRDGFWLGFAWGWGAFIAGVSWLYVALNRYGGMPAPLAGLAIALFCAYLALYPALVGAAFVRLRCAGWGRAPLVGARYQDRLRGGWQGRRRTVRRARVATGVGFWERQCVIW